MADRPGATSERPHDFRADEAFAREMDARDPLRSFRDRFHIPRQRDGKPVIYFAGHSLGLQPKATRAAVEQELNDWAELGVNAHFNARIPWYRYHERFREPVACLVGALPLEVVIMNALTINLHLLLVSFYQPDATRYKIVMEHNAFPSDTYAVKTQLRHHGIDPADGLIIVQPRAGRHTICTQDVEELLAEQGDRIALVWMAGLNFFTGQLFDMRRIAAAAADRGCTVGFDLAHAVGNVPLKLHDWGVDFAVWCSYKYLNAGPGAAAGCFVHERHGRNPRLNRFAGWWGNDPDKRFLMHLVPEFAPVSGADGWQVSNPSILAMAPLGPSLDLFQEATFPALRAKSCLLTGYLHDLLVHGPVETLEVITPRDPAQRGCQLSIRVHDDPDERMAALQRAGVVCDRRPPDVIRVAPVPFYNTFHEVWLFARALSEQPA